MKLSVIIPHLNYGKYLNACLDSVYNQTFKDFEVILVDGGSTDNTFDILKNYPEVNVFKTNLGMVQSVNRGAKEMAGEYFTQVNSDDILNPKLFELCMNEFEKDPSLGLVYTGWIFIDENEIPIGIPWFQPFTFNRGALLKGNYIDSVGTVIPKKILDEMEGFDERVKYHFDWLIAIKISKKYNVKYVEKPLFYFRRHASSKINDSKWSDDLNLASKIIREMSL